MDDNYLWNRTGEPDPEIQKLEELLGTLRYQPWPLQIPANISIARRRNYFPLAIAAAIALLVIGAALWFQVSRSQPKPRMEALDQQREQPKAPLTGSQQPEQPVNVRNDNDNEKLMPPPRKRRATDLVAVKRRRENRVQTREPILTAEEQAEKEQVLLALRLVSAKLNIAQRKVVGAPANIIRNQHKIG